MQQEFIGLKRDSNGKIDHDPSGIDSKDAADAITGALYNASQNAEQFAFDFGETLDNIIDVSQGTPSISQQKEQIKVAFEDELKSLLDPLNKYKPPQENEAKIIDNSNEKLDQKPEQKQVEKQAEKPVFKDFGMGPAQVYKPQYLSTGIVYPYW